MEKNLEGQEYMAVKIHRPGEGLCNNRWEHWGRWGSQRRPGQDGG